MVPAPLMTLSELSQPAPISVVIDAFPCVEAPADRSRASRGRTSASHPSFDEHAITSRLEAHQLRRDDLRRPCTVVIFGVHAGGEIDLLERHSYPREVEPVPGGRAPAVAPELLAQLFGIR